MNKIAQKIRRLREEKNISQGNIADQLSISRPTYIQIEKGKREPTSSELEKLADILGVEVSCFFDKTEKGREIILNSGGKGKAKKQEAASNIKIPRSQVAKFKEVLLYMLEKVGGKPNVGETVIYKLLYFIDFNFFEKYEKKLTGATYIKNHHGPTPVEFKKVVDEMIEDGEIERVRSSYFKYDQKKYLPRRTAELDILSGTEIECINDVLERLSDKNAKDLSDYSHRDVPWIIHKSGEPIKYETVFYRTPEFAQRDYDKEFVESSAKDVSAKLPPLSAEEYEYYRGC